MWRNFDVGQRGSKFYDKNRFSSTLPDYPTARHARREAGIQCHGRQLKLIPEAWIPAIPAGMTLFEKRG